MFGKSHQVHPNYKVAEVDRTFTGVAKPLLLRTAWANESPPTSPLRSPATTSTTRSANTLASMRTGDGLSYSLNPNNSIHLEPKSSQRMYRILAYREDDQGKKVFYDMIDGRIYAKGPGLANRLSRNVVLFDSKDAALSERFPFNQVGAAKGGNGLHPRVLASFDAWGEFHRRYGGGPAVRCEYAKLMKIVDFLDPPNPVPKRLSDRYVEPFFFTTADRSPPNRQRGDPHFKVNRLFSLK